MPSTPIADLDVQLVPPSDLYLDPRNPRLAGGLEVSIEDQDGILEWLWKEKSVNELVDSISASGYWNHEELFAAKEDSKLVVVEGNRRLAAVKLLCDEELRDKLGVRIHSTPSAVNRATLEKLPVVIRERNDIWSYIGFKHVNGPQAWDSLAKAGYIHHVHRDIGRTLEEIAQTIGDRHDTVIRLYRGYLVLHQAQSKGLFNPNDRQQKKFPFSHLWTGLGYTNVQNFLGLSDNWYEKTDPVPESRLEELKDFMRWLFGSRQADIQPKVKKQNPDLRNLAEVLGKPKSIDVLRAGLPLTAAHDASLGDRRLFRDALTLAEEKLRSAKSYVATGYDNEEDLLDTARSLVKQARSLHREMKDMYEESEDDT